MKDWESCFTISVIFAGINLIFNLLHEYQLL